MLNNQEYITAELEKILYKILPILAKRLKNLVAVIIGILLSKSVIISEISQKLKDNYTDATEESQIKRIYRFLSISTVKSDYLYYCFIQEIIKNYVKRNNSNKIVISIIPHGTIR